MINEHDIKDWWLTEELKQLREEVTTLRTSEESYSGLYRGLENINRKINGILKEAYDRMGDK